MFVANNCNIYGVCKLVANMLQSILKKAFEESF